MMFVDQMPVYHFHITDGHKVFDPRGMELPNEDAARRYAAELAHSFAPLVRGAGIDTFVEVVNESGTPVARLVVDQ
jgi:Domain of unknown function (DUF6894)